MIQLKDVGENVKRFGKYFERSKARFCDFSVGVKYMWREDFVISYAFFNDTLIMRESCADYKNAFYFPFAENADDENAALKEIEDYCASRKEELKKAAEDAEKKYVPEGSTLERELHSYEQTWNKMLSPQARENLTEDVNSLIRDYMRKILKTLRANNFTPERIRNLADTLVKTPNMQKIKDHAELHMYIQLYMIKLIKGL